MKRTHLALALVCLAVPAQNPGALALLAEFEGRAARVDTPSGVHALRGIPTVPELLQKSVPTRGSVPRSAPQGPKPHTSVIRDSAGLRAALLAGGAYELAPGEYVGNFVAASPVTLTGAIGLTGRVAPADVAAWRLVAEDSLAPVLTVTGSQVTVRGLTLAGVAPDRTVVVVGSNTATTRARQPTGVTFEQVAVVAAAAGGHRGLELHGADVRVSRSHVAGFLEANRDSQAVWINNGPGPYLIEDNLLEASGENLMVGGDTVRIPGLVPADITIRGNTLVKPQAWRARRGSVKNTFELKCAERVLFENNVLDGMWRDAQAGHMIVLTPRNQNGDSPWCGVSDVTIRRNRSVRHTDGYAVNIAGRDDNHPSQQTARITIAGNLFEDSPKGFMVSGGVTGWLRLIANTLPAVRWNLLTFSGTGVLTPLTVERMVALSGEYGVSGDGTAPGTATLAAYTSALVWTGNVIERTPARDIPWPAGTTLLAPGALAPLLDNGRYVPGGAGW